MLADLRIQNFAIIDDIFLCFDEGLNIVTGDTGAGKSILVGALGLVLGGRGSPDLIRTGASQARITACFNLRKRPEQIERLQALGLELSGDELVVHRTVGRSGKNKVTVNGDPVTVGLLSRMSESLVDIHGQHEHHSLLNEENHIDLLDAFGKAESPLSRYQGSYRRAADAREALERIKREDKDREQRIDFLQYQIGEIDGFDPRPGEEEKLTEERQILRNAERISALAHEAYGAIYESDDSISDRLGQVLAQVKELAALDQRTASLAEQGEDIKYGLEDVAHALRDYASGIAADPERLAVLEDRLDGLRDLKRKYGESVDGILRFREEAHEELSRLMGSVENRARLNEEYERFVSEAETLARKLSEARAKAARRMERELERELGELGMSGTRFVVRRESRPGGVADLTDTAGRLLTDKGFDEIDFLVAPNPGEAPKPLLRIASGGELSRIMLAMKTVLADGDRVDVQIFDEVDTGIGGGVAEILGRKLHDVARGRQVICVTHLPQVASQGETHHHVSKEVQKGRTRVVARQLKGKNRIQEIARMLGGVKITSTTVEHAREMLNLAAQ